MLPKRSDGADGEDVADDGLWPALLGIMGGDSERLEIDGTRAGRFAMSGDAGSDGGLCTPGSATFDTLAFTRTLTLAVETAGSGSGVFSSWVADSASVERAGDDAALISVFDEDNKLEDALPLRWRGKEGA